MSEVTLRGATIGQVALTVRNLATAVRFYRDTLGIEFEFETGGMAFFRCGPTRLMVGLPTGKATQPGTSILYFNVADTEAMYAALARRGIAFLTPPQKIAQPGGREICMAFFRDPDANTLALMSETCATIG